MRGRGLGHGLWVLAFGLVLAPYRPPERAVAPGGVVAEVEQSLLVPTLFVDIRKPALPEVRRAAETTGHILLFVETFLADVPGVVPRLDGVPGEIEDQLDDPTAGEDLAVFAGLVDLVHLGVCSQPHIEAQLLNGMPAASGHCIPQT